MLKKISEQLEMLYCTDATHELKAAVSIGTWYTIEGDPINFLFIQEDDKYSRITTNRNFSDWMSWCIRDSARAAEPISQLAARYGVQWDPENEILFIRFRRNEMTLAQAIMRLQQAVFVVGSIEVF